MKKLLCSILIFMMIVFPLDVFAAENEDSVNLSEEIIHAVRNKSDDTVIRLYAHRYMRKFAERQDIAKLIESVSEVYMVIGASGEISYKRQVEDGFVEITASPYPDWSEFYEYAISPETVFDSSVEVTNIYCLDGSPSRGSVYICYVTDKGDYVLYKEYLEADKTYLMPLNDFYDFAEAVWAEEVKFIDSEGGSGYAIDELFDLEPYEFTPADDYFTYVRIALIVIAAILTGGVIVCGSVIGVKAYRKRKKAQ